MLRVINSFPSSHCVECTDRFFWQVRKKNKRKKKKKKKKTCRKNWCKQPYLVQIHELAKERMIKRNKKKKKKKKKKKSTNLHFQLGVFHKKEENLKTGKEGENEKVKRPNHRETNQNESFPNVMKPINNCPRRVICKAHIKVLGRKLSLSPI